MELPCRVPSCSCCLRTGLFDSACHSTLPVDCSYHLPCMENRNPGSNLRSRDKNQGSPSTRRSPNGKILCPVTPCPGPHSASRPFDPFSYPHVVPLGATGLSRPERQRCCNPYPPAELGSTHAGERRVG